jgi:hypothetical protein
MTDTTPAARDAQIEALRRLGAARRLEIAAEMSDDVRAIALAGKAGESERRVADVEGILRVHTAALDVADLGLEAEWARVRARMA